MIICPKKTFKQTFRARFPLQPIKMAATATTTGPDHFQPTQLRIAATSLTILKINFTKTDVVRVTTRRDTIQLFLAVNSLFVATFVVLAIMQPPMWGWVLFVILWCAVDYGLATDIHLAWWHWALLIAGLVVIDVAVLHATGQI